MMANILSFIRRERLYILIAVFVMIIGVLSALPDGKHAKKDKTKSTFADFEKDYLTNRAKVDKLFSEKKSVAALFGCAFMGIFLIFSLGIIINAMLLLYKIGGKKLDLASYSAVPVKWGVWDAFKVLILFFFFGDVLIIMEAFLKKTCSILSNEYYRIAINSSALDIIAVVLIIYFSIGMRGARLEELGINFRNFWKNVFIGITGYVALVPVLISIVTVLAVIMNALKYVPEQQVVVDTFFKEENKKFLFLMSVFAAVVGPIIEELFFRGFAYGALKKRFGAVSAAFITAGASSALHAYLVGFLPIFAIGLTLAYLYEKTGTLVAPITAHIMHNMGMVSMVFLLKQLKV